MNSFSFDQKSLKYPPLSQNISIKLSKFLKLFLFEQGSALGVNEIIQLTNDEIHRVNVNVAAVREIYENAKALTLQPTYFYSK